MVIHRTYDARLLRLSCPQQVHGVPGEPMLSEEMPSLSHDPVQGLHTGARASLHPSLPLPAHRAGHLRGREEGILRGQAVFIVRPQMQGALCQGQHEGPLWEEREEEGWAEIPRSVGFLERPGAKLPMRDSGLDVAVDRMAPCTGHNA